MGIRNEYVCVLILLRKENVLVKHLSFFVCCRWSSVVKIKIRTYKKGISDFLSSLVRKWLLLFFFIFALPLLLSSPSIAPLGHVLPLPLQQW